MSRHSSSGTEENHEESEDNRKKSDIWITYIPVTYMVYYSCINLSGFLYFAGLLPQNQVHVEVTEERTTELEPEKLITRLHRKKLKIENFDSLFGLAFGRFLIIISAGTPNILRISRFTSVPSCKCQDSISNEMAAYFFYIIFSSIFIDNSIIRCRIAWAKDNSSWWK